MAQRVRQSIARPALYDAQATVTLLCGHLAQAVVCGSNLSVIKTGITSGYFHCRHITVFHDPSGRIPVLDLRIGSRLPTGNDVGVVTCVNAGRHRIPLM